MEKRLTADLNVVANSNLEIHLLDGDLNIIQKLDDEPNDVGGLTSAELKAKFDESGNIIKKYINETLIPAVLTEDATEENRKQAEAARAAAEQGRVTAEEGRVSAESGRVSAEQARANAEASRVSAETAREAAETARADETAGIVARATAQANAAAGSASQAAGSEQAAKSAANTAFSAASSAGQSAAAASGSASQAQASAAAAAQSAASVDGVNKTAQSWAVGGTGTRPGEDTNNAKYWARQAQAAVGGDFATKTEAQGYVTEHNQSVGAHADIRAAVAGSVRYDAAQSLSDAQEDQARGNIGAAPDGFGLGANGWPYVYTVVTGDIINELDRSGLYWYLDNNNPLYTDGWNSGTSGLLLHLEGDSHNTLSARQVFYPNYAVNNAIGATHVERVKTTSGEWQPWEFVYPPMVIGNEYRTTERYLGNPVYVKTVDFGALPNASYKFVSIESGASIIRASGIASNGKTIPGSIGASQREQVLCMGSGNSVEIITYADASNLTATVTAWYTKTTD